MSWIVDPTGYWQEKGVDQRDLIESLGIIPTFLQGEWDGSIMDRIDDTYIYSKANWKQSQEYDTEENGSYTYPGDPKSVPVARFDKNGETFFFHQYAMCFVRKADGTEWHTRVD